MKQFFVILKFELAYFFKNKVFVGMTLALMIIIAGVLFFPRLGALMGNNEAPPASGEDMQTILISGDKETVEYLRPLFIDYKLETTSEDTDALKERVDSDDSISCAVIISSPTDFTYIVNNLSLYDSLADRISEALSDKYRYDYILSLGADEDSASKALNVSINVNSIQTGKDQFQTFFYTYILIFCLYMAIILYGQIVATNVASEKSSRAMELLITSAKPNSLMFGKVIGSGLAGLIQMSLLLGSSFLFFNMNKEYWEDNMIINSIFNMPLSILLYTLLFFVLGFFIYAFLYGAIGSLASRLEDINTTVLPVTFLFIISFMVVVFSMSTGNIDNIAMVVCSYVPFTSPMAMFTRIAMGNVPWYGILISIVILFASTIGTGYLAAKIYRVGVLLYGNTPKLSSILKNLKNS